MLNANWQEFATPLQHLRLDFAPCCPGGYGVTVAFSLASDGHDAGRSDFTNLGYDEDGRAASGDDRRGLAEALGLTAERLVFMEQVHGGAVATVTAEQGGAGLVERGSAVRGVDGLVMVAPERGLVVADCDLGLVGLSADCTLTAIFDDVAGVVAMVHGGWRGLRAGVLGAAVAEMVKSGAAVARLKAVTGPAIGPCCYEVGDEVVEGLLAAGMATAEHFHCGEVRRNDAGGSGVHLDLGGVVSYQLAAAGLAAENVAVSRLCTMCGGRRFHSYRRDGAAAGRQAMAVRLRKRAE